MFSLNRAGQSMVEALLVVVIMTSVASLMFHSGIRITRHLVSEQFQEETTLLLFASSEAEAQ